MLLKKSIITKIVTIKQINLFKLQLLCFSYFVTSLLKKQKPKKCKTVLGLYII